jgi:hypothetical protein
MNAKPILFSTPMVSALLEGRKTTTRRLLKPQPLKPFDAIFNDNDGWHTGDALTGNLIEKLNVKYEIGDLLWVREAWAPLLALKHGDPCVTALANRGFYKADNSVHDKEIERWKPSIHMPRWASRITLEVTAMKVERLQDISEDDAIAEGLEVCTATNGHKTYQIKDICGGQTPQRAFRILWESINGEGSWDLKPWVVAPVFTVHKCNMSEMI